LGVIKIYNHMKKILLSSLLILTFGYIGQAQMPTVDVELQQEMAKLEFMIGQWEGSGWTMGPDMQRHTFDQTENIQFKIAGTAILIEGLGTTEGTVSHNAMAVITYSKEKQHYLFRSFLFDGRSGEYKAELIDGKFHWYLNDEMRYIIHQNEKGQWYEIGQINRNGNWYPFFEMTLNKSK
jgi:hypothetical protein